MGIAGSRHDEPVVFMALPFAKKLAAGIFSRCPDSLTVSWMAVVSGNEWCAGVAWAASGCGRCSASAPLDRVHGVIAKSFWSIVTLID